MNDIKAGIGRNASAQALLDIRDLDKFQVPYISRNQRGVITKTNGQYGDNFVASGGAPLRSSYKSLAKREG